MSDAPSEAARVFAARIARTATVVLRLELRNRYEKLCERSSVYATDRYDQRSEIRALMAMEGVLKERGL